MKVIQSQDTGLGQEFFSRKKTIKRRYGSKNIQNISTGSLF